eukprot:1160040-Pelagomonas_calceolata.AAC.2
MGTGIAEHLCEWTIGKEPQDRYHRASAYFGRPACMANSARIMAAPGSFSLGLRTNVFPEVTA